MERKFTLKITTHYRLQKSKATKNNAMHLTRENAQENGSLLQLTFVIFNRKNWKAALPLR